MKGPTLAPEPNLIWPPDVAALDMVVTGAGSGMGAAIAEHFTRAGARVAFADIADEPIRSKVADLRADGGSAVALVGDVADRDVVERWADELVGEWGRVGVLVNCAGIWSDVPVDELEPEEWSRVLDVNLNGTMFACRAFGRRMREVRSGSIINFTSLSGLLGFRRRAAYTAAKHGVIGLTRVLSAEWAADGVRVNAIAPGRFDTALAAEQFDDPERKARWLQRVPMARTAAPAEMVGPITFLATPMSSYVSGIVLPVDGGYTAS
jgi:NAD(P)-dependent dehydrogenase (short-subunit alcohol dehydrogenase family)